MLSKRSTLIAITVMAALSIEVGCGDGKKQPTRLAHNVPGKTTTAPTKFDKNGKPIPATDAGKDTSTKADQNVSAIAKEETDLQAGKPVTREDLTAGVYTLSNVVTSIHYMVALEDARAIQQSNVDASNPNDFRLVDAGNKLSAGIVSNLLDTPRSIQLPSTFTIKTAGQWDANPDRLDVNLSDSVTTPKDGKPVLTDTIQRSADVAASVLKILSEGKWDDKAKMYTSTDSNNIPLSLTLIQKDATNLTVLMNVGEKRATGAEAATTKNVQNVTYDRNFYLQYTIAAKQADKITVKEIPAAAPAATAAPATAAPDTSTATPAPTTTSTDSTGNPFATVGDPATPATN
jgi:hypothetical protein